MWRSTGVLTRYPLVAPFGLTLGPGLPSADEPSGGSLWLSGRGIPTRVFATQANSLTPRKVQLEQ